MPDTAVTSPPVRRSLTEKLRAEMYLALLDWHLEAVLLGKERRATIKELRQALANDPRDMDASLRDLGAPKTLAEQYAVDAHRRPLWSIGVITAGAALLVYWTVFLSYVFGMLAAVESLGAGHANATFFTIEVGAFSTAESFGISWTGNWAWLIVPAIIATLAFLLGARSWRAFTGVAAPR
ncbi:hypothetical protein AC792_03705 [Arthrobacter sp. RIT-PI-e]|uniref:hypothetical protein n=1 Tax=Arthrobacter sp. RIT-PI-e TaxID=1681197 RepID=UPI0006760580|nr:hypothetical protein [Arthrobacter sp. RIT-PI-e]KNC19893.1 hypothetical protein AC792_03705 [Arthrobacter sp. RIT-PI-e]